MNNDSAKPAMGSSPFHQRPPGPIEQTVPRTSSDTYPKPVIVPPSSSKHEQSLIILHGRGSNGGSFGSHLLMWDVPEFSNLQAAFPNAKFIFPTAAMRQAAALDRTPLSQWFDCWSLRDPNEREELQYEGLKESTEHVHQLLNEEISAVGASNVVLWGLSQGWATSMVALLLWEGEPLAAAIGMCGWLPLEKRMRNLLDSGNVEANDPFAMDQTDVDSGSGAERASGMGRITDHLREVLDMPSQRKLSTSTGVPVFVGHGTEDEKVALTLGRDAVKLLREVGIHVDYKEYEGLHHWYSSKMLYDIVNFLEQNTGWTIPRTSTEANGE